MKGFPGLRKRAEKDEEKNVNPRSALAGIENSDVELRSWPRQTKTTPQTKKKKKKTRADVLRGMKRAAESVNLIGKEGLLGIQSEFYGQTATASHEV